jgi:hypothetical protein
MRDTRYRGAVVLGLGVGAREGACDIVGVGVCELWVSLSLSMARSLSSLSFCKYHAAFSSSVLLPQVIMFCSTHSRCWSTVQSGQKPKGVPAQYGLGDLCREEEGLEGSCWARSFNFCFFEVTTVRRCWGYTHTWM